MREAEIVRVLERDLHISELPVEVRDALREDGAFRDLARVPSGDDADDAELWLELFDRARVLLRDYEHTSGLRTARTLSSVPREAITEREWLRSIYTSQAIADEVSDLTEVQTLRAALPGRTTLSSSRCDRPPAAARPDAVILRSPGVRGICRPCINGVREFSGRRSRSRQRVFV